MTFVKSPLSFIHLIKLVKCQWCMGSNMKMLLLFPIFTLVQGDT